MDNRKVGIVIPTFNRYDMVIEATSKVIDDDRIKSITIVDDCSEDDSYSRLLDYYHWNEKVSMYRNSVNLDCYFCKHRAVKLSTSENVIVLDSDNIIDKSYLDAIYAIEEWDSKTIYQPEFARPHFDFRQFSGLEITSKNTPEYKYNNYFEVMLNAMNFFINRDEYLKVWDGSINPVTSDSIYFNYCWLNAGNKIYVTPNMQYEHTVHDGSHYQLNNKKTPQGFHRSILDKLNALK